MPARNTRAQSNAPSLDRFLARPSVSDLTSLSKATIYRKVAEKTFPAPVKIGKAALRGANQRLRNGWSSKRPLNNDAR